MKLRLFTASMVVALLAMFIAAPLSASAAPKPKSKPAMGTAVLTGTGPDGNAVTGAVTNLTAVFDAATGLTTITGTLTGTLSGILTGILTGAAVTGSCQILLLDLGPVFLDVLGLQIDLSQVVLEITAVPGAGNLLGNLLCAVANLLNGGGLLADLTGLLNNIFRRLG
jgi:hypothetical protein